MISDCRERYQWARLEWDIKGNGWGFNKPMSRNRLGQKHGAALITAAVIACWAYCPEQWRLQYGLGLQPANRKGLATGDRHHAENRDCLIPHFVTLTVLPSASRDRSGATPRSRTTAIPGPAPGRG